MARKAMRQGVGATTSTPTAPQLPKLNTSGGRGAFGGSGKAVAGLTSANLVPPASGLMSGKEARVVSPVIQGWEDRARNTIADREAQDVTQDDQYEEYRRQQLLILREKERMALRQRTAARLSLQARSRQTGDDLDEREVQQETAATAQREARKTIPQQAFVESNRSRMEIALIRRNEERETLKQRSENRKFLESKVGTSYAGTQNKLLSTISASRSNVDTTMGITAEDAFKCEMEGREEKWRENEERKEVERAMRELNALDERLIKEEEIRRDERRAKKEKLREDSRRRDD
jgi:hypothetical protein